MAVFLLKAKHGLCYAPPPCTGQSSPTSPAPPPSPPGSRRSPPRASPEAAAAATTARPNPVRRDQMAVFLLKAEHGSATCRRPARGVLRRRALPVARSPTGSSSSPPRASPAAAAAATTARSNTDTRGQMAVVRRRRRSACNRTERSRRSSNATRVRHARFRLLFVRSSPLASAPRTFTVTNTNDSRRRVAAPGDPRRQREPGRRHDRVQHRRRRASTRSRRRRRCRPITEAVTIDGYTQPGSSVNTDPVATNAVLLIELDGSAAGPANGLSARTSHDGDDLLQGLVDQSLRDAGVDLSTEPRGGAP